MGRPPKSTMVQTSHADIEELGMLGSHEVKVPGYVFKWVNIEQRYRRGWGIWTPVTRDSEMGQQVVPQLGYGNDKFNGANQDANLIYQGVSSVLAYSTVEKNEALKAYNAAKAEERIKTIDAAELRRNVIIPATGGYMSQFGGNT